MINWHNLNNLGKIALVSAIVAAIGLIIGFVSYFLGYSLLSPLRIFFGSIYVLFLPGFILTFIFFSNKSRENKIDWIERIALSFALSIAVVPLVVFYLNLIGLKISALNTFLTILGIIIIELVILFFMNKKRRYHPF